MRLHDFSVVVPSSSQRIHTTRGLTFEYWMEAEGWWSPVYPVTAGVSEDPFVMTVYPTGSLTGALVAESSRVPAELELRFEPAAGGDGAVPPGTVACAVDAGGFHCAAPAGVLDLTLEADGYRLVTFPGVEVVRGASRELETVELMAEEVR